MTTTYPVRTKTVVSKCYGNTKQYIALVTGTDPKYGEALTFVGRKSGQQNFADFDEASLIKSQSINKKGNAEISFVLYLPLDGVLAPFEIDTEHEPKISQRTALNKITARLDKGESIEDICEVLRDDADVNQSKYRIRTALQAEKVLASVTADSAYTSCLEILVKLDEKRQKDILKRLKVALLPPVSIEPVTDSVVA